MELEWDNLNKETFGSDVSDAEDSQSWEKRHFEFVAATTGNTSALQTEKPTNIYQDETALLSNGGNNERNAHFLNRQHPPSSDNNISASQFCTPASFQIDPTAMEISRGGRGPAVNPPSPQKMPPPGFETCAYEVGNKSRYPLNSFFNEQSLNFPSEKFSNCSSFLPFEIEVDNSPFEKTNAPSSPQGPDDFNFEQSLAKSFDDMFNEDLLEGDFEAAEESASSVTETDATTQVSGSGVGGASSLGNNRRCRNISESELFPDSYKFSPPFPSVNICVNETGASSVAEKNIWDMEHEENDNDYINRHIKALLKIQPSPKPNHISLSSNKGGSVDEFHEGVGGSFTVQETRKVYTLEELEDSTENVSSTSRTESFSNENSKLNSGVGVGVNQLPLPIGTPPQRNDAMAAAQMMKHAQKLGGMPIQKGPNSGGAPTAAAAMSIHDQLALAQLTQAATAAYLRDKQAVAAATAFNISSPPRLAAGIPHNVAQQPHLAQLGPTHRNVPYPHPIPQGGRVQRNTMGNGPGCNVGRNHPQHNRYHQSSSNNYNQKGVHNNNRGGHMKEHEPIVKGLMSQKEMEWIFKVQMMQLKMSDFHVEDYYYQQWVKSRTPSQHLDTSHDQSTASNCNPSQNQPSSSTASQISQKHDISTSFSTSTGNKHISSISELAQLPSSSVVSNRNRKITETSSDGEVNSNNQQATEKGVNGTGGTERQKQQPEPKKAYEPTRFENTLGKISVGSVYKPRKLMDIEFVCRESCVSSNATGGGGSGGSNILKDSKRHREHLLFIEKCLTLFDELEQSERRNQGLASHSDAGNSQHSGVQSEETRRSRREMRKERDDLKKLILKHFDFTHLEDIVKNILLCADKGCRLLAELLTILSDEENVLLMLAVVNNLYIVIKKEHGATPVISKGNNILTRKQQFGVSLCASMKEAINKLQSNIDNVEILEMLVSTVNWKTSTFATSLLIILFESIARGKQRDSFSYRRLIEILASVETQMAPASNSSLSNSNKTSNSNEVDVSSENALSSTVGGSNKNGGSFSSSKGGSGSNKCTMKSNDVAELFNFVTGGNCSSNSTSSNDWSSMSLKQTLQLVQTDVRLPHFSKFILSSVSSSK